MASGNRYALSFNGSSSQAVVNNPVDITGGNPWTVEMWFKKTLAGTAIYNLIGGNPVFKYDSSYLSVNNGKIGIWDKAAAKWYYSNTPIDDNVWYHVALVCSPSGAISLYINGVLDTGIAFTTTTVANRGLMVATIGSATGQRYFGGVIDELRVWNVARTQEEINKNKGKGVSPYSPNIVSLFRMEEGTSVAVDSVVPTRTTTFADVSWVAAEIDLTTGLSLIQTGSSVKYYDHTTSSWVTVGSAPATESMFNSFGTYSLDDLPSSAWEQLPDKFDVLTWTDDSDVTGYTCLMEVVPFRPILQLSPNTVKVEMWTNAPDQYIPGGSTENVIPAMTSDTTPEGRSDASTIYGGAHPAWKAFDKMGADSSWATASGVSSGWLSYEFPTAKVITSYSLVSRNPVGSILEMPVNWTFEGWDETRGAWDTLDSRSGETWSLSVKRTFSFSNTKPYKKYRLNGNSGYASYMCIGEMEMFESLEPILINPTLYVEGEKFTKYRYKVLLDDSAELKVSDWVYGDIRDSVIVDDSYIKTINPYTIKVVVEQSNGVTIEDSGKVTLIDTEPTLVATMTGMRLDLNIGDPEGDKVQFRVLLNGTQIHPSTGASGFTQLLTPPITYSKLLRSDQVTVGGNNTLQIIALDEFGKESNVTLNFIGEYAGLLFADETGSYYSDDLGNILQYLDIGILVAGQVSDTYPIRLINRTGFTITHLELWKDRKTLPPSAAVEISKTDVPFEPIDLLTYDQIFNYNDEVTFYVRVVTQINGQPGQGEFDVFVKGDPS